MDKYITKYSTGSIMGRTVYVSNKNSIKASGISIFGTKVYKDCERHRRWGKYIKKIPEVINNFFKLLSSLLKRIYVLIMGIGSCTGATGRVPTTQRAGERKKKC